MRNKYYRLYKYIFHYIINMDILFLYLFKINQELDFE